MGKCRSPRAFRQLEDCIEIQLTQDQVTYIDLIDSDLAQVRWCAAKMKHGFYALCYRKGRVTVYLHRVILERKLGHSIPDGIKCDHADLDSLNNRRNNLRLATNSQNGHNRHMQSKTTGYRGVTQDKRCKTPKFWAHIRVEGKDLYLGMFTNAEDAYAAYVKAAKQYYGEYARLD